jgi:hypothetical protein
MMSAVNGEKVELRCNNKIATLLNKNGDITIPRRINCGSDETTFYNPTIVAKYAMRLECPNIDSTAMLFIHTSNNQLMVQNKKGVNVGLVDLANGKRITNETVIHTTNIVGNFEIGTFCEANGNIYDGYEKINNTDCICAVKQATLLNKKIVGIVINQNEFASHGDVLVRIAPETICEVGDILCPDERGYGRVASEDELIFMMMYAIPRPKITCLETGIEGFVACFIV